MENWGGILLYAQKSRRGLPETLHGWGIRCIAYHGGMSEAEREQTQNDFISKKS